MQRGLGIIEKDATSRRMAFQNPFWRQSDWPVYFQIKEGRFLFCGTLYLSTNLFDLFA